MSRLDLVWEDQLPPSPAELEIGDLELALGPVVVPGDEASKFSTSMRIGKEGRFSAKGTARAGSRAVEAEFALEKIGLAAFQPYAAQVITGSVARGELEVKGTASYSPARSSCCGARSARGGHGGGRACVRGPRS